MLELVEQHRVQMADWLDKQAIADQLRETKNDVLAKMVIHAPGKSHAEKERNARASQEWTDYVDGMLHAEDLARRAKFSWKQIEMKFEALRTLNANARREMDSQRFNT